MMMLLFAPVMYVYLLESGADIRMLPKGKLELV